MAKRPIRTRVGEPGAKVLMTPMRVKNKEPQEFRQQIINTPLLAYDVEDLKDGRKVLVSKPGGKSVHNIMVWIYEGPNGTHWRPSHGGIYKDLAEKLKADKGRGLKVLDALQRVFSGEDPDDILERDPKIGESLPGHPVDLLLKAYKWIWVQEDCNYPPPHQGRQMSMDKIMKLYNP